MYKSIKTIKVKTIPVTTKGIKGLCDNYGQSGKCSLSKSFKPNYNTNNFRFGKTQEVTSSNEEDYYKRLAIVKTQNNKLKQKLGEKKYFEIVKNIYKKAIEHGDTIEKIAEFGKSIRGLSWQKQKQKIKQRFPYLTNKEVDFLGFGSGLKDINK